MASKQKSSQSKNKPAAKLSKKTVTLLIVAFILAAVAGARIVIDNAKPDPAQVALARTKGNPKAVVQITEYLDFQCPVCAKSALFLNKYIKEYPDRLHLQLKYFPLETLHANAVRSARYAECAAREGKFWPVHDGLMTKQPEWKNLSNADPIFAQIARDAGLDQGKLERCLADDTVREILFKEKAEGAALGVNSTPTYFVNGKMVVGPKSLEDELRNYFGGGAAPAAAGSAGSAPAAAVEPVTPVPPAPAAKSLPEPEKQEVYH